MNFFTINKFKRNFYQDGNNCKHNLIPIEINKNDCYKVIESTI